MPYEKQPKVHCGFLATGVDGRQGPEVCGGLGFRVVMIRRFRMVEFRDFEIEGRV